MKPGCCVLAAVATCRCPQPTTACGGMNRTQHSVAGVQFHSHALSEDNAVLRQRGMPHGKARQTTAATVQTSTTVHSGLSTWKTESGCRCCQRDTTWPTPLTSLTARPHRGQRTPHSGCLDHILMHAPALAAAPRHGTHRCSSSGFGGYAISVCAYGYGVGWLFSCFGSAAIWFVRMGMVPVGSSSRWFAGLYGHVRWNLPVLLCPCNTHRCGYTPHQRVQRLQWALPAAPHL